jgi:hypothetical protein
MVSAKKSVKKELWGVQEETQKLREKVKGLNKDLRQAKLQITQLQREKRKNPEKIKELPAKPRINSVFETNKIYNLDCLELFKKMKENKIMVDAIISDPPYNISKINNFASIGRTGIDFGH